VFVFVFVFVIMLMVVIAAVRENDATAQRAAETYGH
jgi:hypothetical protein